VKLNSGLNKKRESDLGKLEWSQFLMLHAIASGWSLLKSAAHVCRVVTEVKFQPSVNWLLLQGLLGGSARFLITKPSAPALEHYTLS
jgi:hypothetical protein